MNTSEAPYYVRRPATLKPYRAMLDLIECRFGIRLPVESVEQLRHVCEHYTVKRQMILWEHGEAGALARDDYAKSVMISEVVRLMLREITPRLRRKQIKRT